MCSYQNMGDANFNNIISQNWEEEFWASALLRTQNAQIQFSGTKAIEVNSEENVVPTTFDIQSNQVESFNCYQNAEPSKLLSPTWEEQFVEIPQSNISMSTYFSSFNPTTQFQPVRADCQPGTNNVSKNNLKTQQHVPQTMGAIGKMHRARINFVPTSNGSFKAIVKRKRKRTVFTTEQVQALEEVFSRKPYVTREERQVLVNQLQVNDKSVKVWFQNRRLKYKKGDDTVDIDIEHCQDIDRLDYVESKINERTDEFGFVTLDDRIISDLVAVVNDYISNGDSSEELKPETSSPIYEPISPASNYSCEDNSTPWCPSESNDSVQQLIDLESIINQC